MLAGGFDAAKSPITQQGKVIYNCRRDDVDLNDRRQNAPIDFQLRNSDDVFTIQIRDACLAKRLNNQTYVAHSDLMVTGCTNGMRNRYETRHERLYNSIDRLTKNLPLHKDEANAYLRMILDEGCMEEYTFAGFANTRCLYDSTSANHEDNFTVQLGGMMTVINTGADTMSAGDLVYWSIRPKANTSQRSASNAPRYARTPGQPQGKEQVVLLPLGNPVDTTTSSLNVKNFDEHFDACLLEIMNGSLSDPVKVETIKKLAEFKLMSHETKQKRVIGRALSSSEPGKPFDILIGRYAVS